MPIHWIKASWDWIALEMRKETEHSPQFYHGLSFWESALSSNVVNEYSFFWGPSF